MGVIGGRGVGGLVVDWEGRAEEKMEESSAGRVDYQWGFFVRMREGSASVFMGSDGAL